MSSALKWTNEVNHALCAIIHLKVNMSSITACSDKQKIIRENKQTSPVWFPRCGGHKAEGRSEGKGATC